MTAGDQHPNSTHPSDLMATVAPPPSKRQKLAAVEKAEKKAEDARIPEDLGSVRIQFVDQSTGKPTGSVVAVPVKDATVKNLETLLNTIQGNVRRESAHSDWAMLQRPLLLTSVRIPPNDYPIASSFATIEPQQLAATTKSWTCRQTYGILSSDRATRPPRTTLCYSLSPKQSSACVQSLDVPPPYLAMVRRFWLQHFPPNHLLAWPQGVATTPQEYGIATLAHPFTH